MIKIWLVVFLFSISFSYAQTCESRHHIFLIHGIGGSEKTFGAMDEYLEKINPCNVATYFNYETGDSSQSTYDFSKSMDQFIKKTMVRNNFGANDRISFVMHSQGGLVTSIWLLNARKNDPEIYSKVDSFISLSTPYYGSKIAKLGRWFFFNMNEKYDNPISPMGRIELREMSYGSPTIHALQSNFDNIFRNSHIRFLAIGGIKEMVNTMVGEGDTTVTVYSSNPNHYSAELSIAGEDKFTEALGIVPFTTVEATHIPSTLPGIAKIDNDCVKSESCNHPTIGHIVGHLSDKNYQVPKPKQEFRKYRLHVYVKGKAVENLSVRLVDIDGDHYKLKFVQKNDELMSTYYWDYANHSNPGEMQLEFYMGKTFIKSARVKVQGGYSTFVTLKL